MNLLKETLQMLSDIKKRESDIEFIGSGDGQYSCDFEDFCKLANVEYDEGYGGNEVASDLVIVFTDNSWLSRGEYDGSEWWDYNVCPVKQYYSELVSNIINDGYEYKVS